MFELGAEEWQLDFPTVYGSAKNNWMSDHWENVTDNVEALLDMVLMCQLLRFQKVLTNVDYVIRLFSFYWSYRYWSS
jgi:predicted membrane GTPase involved in stress response